MICGACPTAFSCWSEEDCACRRNGSWLVPGGRESACLQGFARLFACQADGVRDLTLQKRDAPAVFKRLKDEAPVLLVKGAVENEKLVSVDATLP